MKKISAILALVLCCAATLSAQQKMPDVKVEANDGTMVSARSLCAGKPAIISYWSIACKPCIQELNAIADALEEWRKDADFTVLAVSVDDVRLKAAAKAKVKSYGWGFACAYDFNQDLMRAMNVSMTPHSFVVDADGNVVLSHSGYMPGDEEELFEKIREICGK